MDRTLAEKAGGVSGYLIRPDCNEETGQVSWVRIPLNSIGSFSVSPLKVGNRKKRDINPLHNLFMELHVYVG